MTRRHISIIAKLLPSPTTLVYIAVAIFVLYFGWLSIARHVNFHSLRLDLGNMDQTVWNISQGRGFTMTDPSSERQVSRFAYHADVLLYAFAPLYFVWSSPIVLLVSQVLIVGVGAIPLYFIARHLLGSPWFALLLSVSYLLFPPLERAVMYDFHAVTLSMSFLMFCFWGIITRRWGVFLVFAILSGLSKEQVWFTTGLLGVYVARIYKQKKLGWGLALLSFFMFYILFWVVIPHYASDNEHFALKYLSDFGSSPGDIVTSILANPLRTVSTLFLRDRLIYLYQLFAPVGFMSVFSPLSLVFALPDFAITLLSNNPLMRRIDFQYQSVMTPFIFISATYGLRNVLQYIKRRKYPSIYQKKVALWLVVCACIISYMWGVLPHQRKSLWWLYLRKPTGYDIMKDVISDIPQDASVSVTNNLGAQMSQRKELYSFPTNAHSVDYVVVKLDDPNALPSLKVQRDVARELLFDPNYELMVGVASFSAFRRIVIPN